MSPPTKRRAPFGPSTNQGQGSNSTLTSKRNVNRNFSKSAETNENGRESETPSVQNDECLHSANESEIIEVKLDIKFAKGLRKEDIEVASRLENDNERVVNVVTLSKDIWSKKRCLKYEDDNFFIPFNLFRKPLWKGPQLQILKKELNDTKNLLDHFELDVWHKHTKLMNTAKAVVPTVRNAINPEYCSQAWCKFYECLTNFDVIPRSIVEKTSQPESSIPFFSVHLCEAPGAFISALNHYIHTNCPQIKWGWLATTLNPHHEGNDVGSMINEDKLILSSIDNWTFLKDGTGNLMNQENMDSLIEKVSQRQVEYGDRVGLVTADGSIDCQMNPTEQEITVLGLQFAEIVAALNILSRGGTFILKIFTFLECQTINHLYLLSSCFRTVHLFKPVTSKEGNSEVYVICLQFVGLQNCKSEVMHLKKFVGLDNDQVKKCSLVDRTMVNRHPFIGRVLEAANFFTGFQKAIIKRNIATFQNPDARLEYFQYELLQNQVAEDWLISKNVRVLPNEKKLFNIYYTASHLTHVDPRNESGSFRDKQRLNSADLNIKFFEIERNLGFYCRKYGYGKCSMSEFKPSSTSLAITRHYPPYKNILSSRFCFGKLLQIRNCLRETLRPFSKELSSDINTCCNEEGYEKIKKYFNDIPELQKQENSIKLQIFCCEQSPDYFLNFSDMNFTAESLNPIISQVVNLEAGESLFLCHYPLLSRLQVGFIYMISSIFEKTFLFSIGKDAASPACGVLLYRSTIISDDLMAVLQEMITIINNLKMHNETNIKLEIVPLTDLLKLENYNDILRYNLTTVSTSLVKLIHKVRPVIIKNNDATKSKKRELEKSKSLEIQSTEI